MIGNGPRITVVVNEDQNENTVISNTVHVEYEAFEFWWWECIVDGDGNVDIIQHKQTGTILVAKHWQRFIRDGSRNGGYIASGLSKFAFKVSLTCYMVSLRVR